MLARPAPAQQTLIGAVVLPPRPDKPMQIYAYGTERSWRGTPTPRHFYDPRTWIWSINEIFAEGMFPDGVAVRLIDPLTRRTVAESPHHLPGTTTQVAPTRNTTVDEAVALLGSVKSAYAGYELDARKLLAYPALIDPHDPISATWYEAFARACALEPEQPSLCPPDHAGRFVAAAWTRRRPGKQPRRTPTPSPWTTWTRSNATDFAEPAARWISRWIQELRPANAKPPWPPPWI